MHFWTTRQLGADQPGARSVSQFERAMLVSKLQAARRRKAEETGRKVGGRKNYGEIDAAMVALAKRLRRYPVAARRRSLREIATELAAAGYLTAQGKPYAAAAVAKMIGRGTPSKSLPSRVNTSASREDGDAQAAHD
jgi:DNA invertase Pin-like site-specific DNA recombinase